MGDRADNVIARFGDRVLYFNLGIPLAYLIGNLLFGQPLERLAYLILGLNCFLLWQRHRDLKNAVRLDQEQESAERRSEAARDV